jgi:hypothetical protein
MYQLTSQHITYRDYPIQYISSPSTGAKEIDIMDELDSLVSVLLRNRPIKFYPNLLSLFEIDWSSVRPHFEIKNETFLKHTIAEEISEEDLFLEMLEHDFVVKMPPKRRYTIELDIKNIRRGEPRIFEIEEITGG